MKNHTIISASASLVIAAAASTSVMAQDGQTPAVERAQFVAQMDAEFARLDGDGDGVVTTAEITASQRNSAQAEALRQNRAVFDRLDADNNGQVSPQEFAQLANPAAVPVDPAPLLGQFDANQDGSITRLEYRVATQGNFDRIDADRDGTITPLEMRAAGIVE